VAGRISPFGLDVSDAGRRREILHIAAGVKGWKPLAFRSRPDGPVIEERDGNACAKHTSNTQQIPAPSSVCHSSQRLLP